MGGIALLFLKFFRRRIEFDVLYLLIFPLLIIFVLTFVIRVDEPRYFVPFYPFFNLYSTFFLMNMYLRIKKNIHHAV